MFHYKKLHAAYFLGVPYPPGSADEDQDGEDIAADNTLRSQPGDNDVEVEDLDGNLEDGDDKDLDTPYPTSSPCVYLCYTTFKLGVLCQTVSVSWVCLWMGE